MRFTIAIVLFATVITQGFAKKRSRPDAEVPDFEDVEDEDEDEDEVLKLLIHLGANYSPYDFLVNLPDAPETQTGFGYEFALELCDVCGLDCYTVRDSYSNCWTGSDTPGVGIQGGYVDVCSTYTHTHLRSTSVEFGHAYTQGRPAGILVRLDENGNPEVSPSDDFSNKTIAVIGGWATNAASLNYFTNECSGELLGDYSTVVPEDEFLGPDQAIRDLLDGTVDAVYAYASTIGDRQGCDSESCDASLYDGLGTDYAWIHTGFLDYQANGTTFAFAKKGSGLHEILNPCIQTVVESEFYADLCYQYAVEQGSDITCFDNDYMQFEIDTFGPASMSNSEREDSGVAEYNDCSAGWCPCN